MVIYRADDGQKLLQIEVGTGIMAAPMTYEVKGEQYVAVMAGYGGAALPWEGDDEALRKYQNVGRVIAFKLNGTHTPLPAQKIRDTTVPEPPKVVMNNKIIEKGKKKLSAIM